MIRIFAVALVVLVTGCTTPEEYKPPPKAILQDPIPGQGLVYFLRAPYDETDLVLFLNGRRLTSLPSLRYTAISLDPGNFELRTDVEGWRKDGSNRIPLRRFSLGAGQRLILFLPAPERQNVGTFGVAPGPAGPIPIFGRRMQETGATREWTEGTESDASWFIHHGKLYLE